MSAAQLNLVNRLTAAWDASPDLRFGQLVESVENVGWDLVTERVCSPRLAWMGDDLFTAACNAWLGVPAGDRKVVAS